MKDNTACSPREVGHRITEGVVLQMPHVWLTTWVREHFEDVGRPVWVGVIADVPGLLVSPDLLPAGFNSGRVVSALFFH
ncbi:unannotated protein [freshwater metagenome]|uniref:Unannotated protein n=1 Tax=freshwater metagenome TaxID=449393 RepID=A0A6J7EAS5_9ZZZZ